MHLFTFMSIDYILKNLPDNNLLVDNEDSDHDKAGVQTLSTLSLEMTTFIKGSLVVEIYHNSLTKRRLDDT